MEAQGPVAAGSQAGTRRTKSAAFCSGTGTNSFLGVSGSSNFAAGANSVVVGGVHDQACDDYGVVVGGYYDIINSSANSAQDSFIGAGYSNQIELGEYSTLVGGIGNTIDVSGGGTASTIGAGGYNTVNAGTATIAGGLQHDVGQWGPCWRR